MKLTTSALLVLFALGGSACTSSETGRTLFYSENFEEKPEIDQHQTEMPKEFSWLELGRTISKGAVDIFDPWMSTFEVTAPENSEPDPLASFSVNPYLLFRDKSVRVYDLPENPMTEPQDLSLPLDLITDTATSPNAPSAAKVEVEPLDIQP